MAEPSIEVSKSQFKRFIVAYNKLHNSDFVWDSVNSNQNDNWDFRGRDINNGKFINIQYTEAIVNHQQKGNLEAFRRGEYEFESAIGLKFSTQIVEEAYGNKLKMADRDVILLVGFHDFHYEKENKYDDVEKIREHIKDKFGHCVFRELWIVNLHGGLADFIF